MAQVYKFFNSSAGDERMYQASDFADYFGSVLSTGLLHTDEVPGMSVSVVSGTLNTAVSSGKAIMKGHLYENTEPLTLTHDMPEATYDRIDRIVLRLDQRNTERNILLHVKKGVGSDTPIAPALQRDNFIYEVSLAQVIVRANTAQLQSDDVLDERLDKEVGGIAHSLISIPTSQFQKEWDDFMESVQEEGFTPAVTFNAHKEDFDTHENDTANPHGVTKAQVGLSNVTNDRQATQSDFEGHVSDYEDFKATPPRLFWSPVTPGDYVTYYQAKAEVIGLTYETRVKLRAIEWGTYNVSFRLTSNSNYVAHAQIVVNGTAVEDAVTEPFGSVEYSYDIDIPSGATVEFRMKNGAHEGRTTLYDLSFKAKISTHETFADIL